VLRRGAEPPGDTILANPGWVLASGVLGVLLAIFLIANPGFSLFFLGIFVGVQLVAEGLAIGWMAWNFGKAGTAAA